MNGINFYLDVSHHPLVDVHLPWFVVVVFVCAISGKVEQPSKVRYIYRIVPRCNCWFVISTRCGLVADGSFSNLVLYLFLWIVLVEFKALGEWCWKFSERFVQNKIKISIFTHSCTFPEKGESVYQSDRKSKSEIKRSEIISEEIFHIPENQRNWLVLCRELIIFQIRRYIFLFISPQSKIQSVFYLPFTFTNQI